MSDNTYIVKVVNPIKPRDHMHVGPFSSRADAQRYVEWNEDDEGLNGVIITVVDPEAAEDAVRRMSERYEIAAVASYQERL